LKNSVTGKCCFPNKSKQFPDSNREQNKMALKSILTAIMPFGKSFVRMFFTDCGLLLLISLFLQETVKF
jgi:hypothetical protein